MSRRKSKVLGSDTDTQEMDEVSRRWAREHIERSPDTEFEKWYLDFAYGTDVPTDEQRLEQELRDEFT